MHTIDYCPLNCWFLSTVLMVFVHCTVGFCALYPRDTIFLSPLKAWLGIVHHIPQVEVVHTRIHHYQGNSLLVSAHVLAILHFLDNAHVCQKVDCFLGQLRRWGSESQGPTTWTDRSLVRVCVCVLPQMYQVLWHIKSNIICQISNESGNEVFGKSSTYIRLHLIITG